MKTEQIAAARKLAAEAKALPKKATPMPWRVVRVGSIAADMYIDGENGRTVAWIIRDDDDRHEQAADAEYIAKATLYLPALADLVDQLAAALEQAQAERDGLADICSGLLDYRRRNTLNFQLEKADYWLDQLRFALHPEAGN